MYERDAYQNPSQTNLETISPTRPPQLNRTVCGCQCRRGSPGEAEEGDPNEDEASTLVASNGSDAESSDELAEGATALANVEELQARIRMFLRDMEGNHHLPTVDGYALSFNHFVLLPDCDNAATSTETEPGSGVHSVTTPDERSVHCISPGPGLGTWATEDGPRIPFRYLFLARPLRLTP
ncbi:hypothetical protein CC80DRAFT_490059 [Byssothecium circinans]|uniref:Uncharacterized protein n=1 Tax=Byssothecium circinans TaxID=147558 RepID=A0A6A5U5F0_9PLEO|nr:hypothetical protein CC80DRAFT_490059 [Byssothecium circinans]